MIRQERLTVSCWFRSIRLAGVLLFAFAGAAVAQVSTIEGKVIGEDGQPLQNAIVRMDRKDIKGKYEVKTRKKGDFLHAGLPLGTYKVTLIVNGQEVDTVDNVRTQLGEPTTVNFDLRQQAARRKAMERAVETGQVTQEIARDMTPEQKAAIERQMKERAAALAKNKALNDAFNAAVEARNLKNWDVAIEQFTKAAELDPKQHVVWANLGDVYMQASAAKASPEKEALLEKSLEAYKKAIELVPTDADYRNNYALALARLKRFDEMQAQIEEAVKLNPAGAGKYYYNLGAVLTNAGQLEPACQAFKKATQADDKYADAHYQYGICLTSQAKTRPDGTIEFPPETAAAFQKYLELRPDGPFAESAKGMLATLNSKVETQYVAPGAKKPTPARKK